MCRPGGSTLGVLLGGVLTDLLDWHWISLVNVPTGIAVSGLAPRVLRASRAPRGGGRLDAAGAVIVTAPSEAKTHPKNCLLIAAWTIA